MNMNRSLSNKAHLAHMTHTGYLALTSFWTQKSLKNMSGLGRSRGAKPKFAADHEENRKKVCVCCLDKSNQSYPNERHIDLIVTYRYANYRDDAEYLPTGLCQSCKTILNSMVPKPGNPTWKPKKFKNEVYYEELAKHTKYTVQNVPVTVEKPCQ